MVVIGQGGEGGSGKIYLWDGHLGNPTATAAGQQGAGMQSSKSVATLHCLAVVYLA